jgi:hypothetical protein
MPMQNAVAAARRIRLCWLSIAQRMFLQRMTIVASHAACSSFESSVGREQKMPLSQSIACPACNQEVSGNVRNAIQQMCIYAVKALFTSYSE